MNKTAKGKKSKGKVRKYNLMTFSEDERSIVSEVSESGEGNNNSKKGTDQSIDKNETLRKGKAKAKVTRKEGAEELDSFKSDENDTVSEVSMYSTENTGRKRKKDGRESVTDIDDDRNADDRNAGDKRKDYSQRKNSSLCEQILAAKSNGLALRKIKSNVKDEEQNDGTDSPHDNDDKLSNTAQNNSKSKKKAPNKVLRFLKVTKSEEDNDFEDTNEDKPDDEIGIGSVEPLEELEEYPSGSIPLEKQVKFCQERASHVEKNYGAFCQTLGSFTRKVARMRDKGDLLAKQVLEFTEKEKVSVSTTKNLRDFAHNLAAIQDYRDAEIHRLDSKVVKPLTAYGPKCKKIKQIIKTEQSAINREIKQRKNLEKVRDKKPGDAHSITATTFQAETEHQKAAADAAIGSQGLQNQMCVFEKDKLTDLKRILADFVSVEMVFHAKAIEYYSQCFENLAMIDEELDLDEFSRKLNLTQAPGPDTLGSSLPVGMTVPQGTITSLGSTIRSTTMETTGTSDYTSTGESYTYTYGDSTTSSGEKRVRIQTVGQSMYADVQDDEEDDDDDDDDDDDYDDGNPQLYSRPMKR